MKTVHLVAIQGKNSAIASAWYVHEEAGGCYHARAAGVDAAIALVEAWLRKHGITLSGAWHRQENAGRDFLVRTVSVRKQWCGIAWENTTVAPPKPHTTPKRYPINKAKVPARPSNHIGSLADLQLD